MADSPRTRMEVEAAMRRIHGLSTREQLTVFRQLREYLGDAVGEETQAENEIRERAEALDAMKKRKSRNISGSLRVCRRRTPSTNASRKTSSQAGARPALVTPGVATARQSGRTEASACPSARLRGASVARRAAANGRQRPTSPDCVSGWLVSRLQPRRRTLRRVHARAQRPR